MPTIWLQYAAYSLYSYNYLIYPHHDLLRYLLFFSFYKGGK